MLFASVAQVLTEPMGRLHLFISDGHLKQAGEDSAEDGAVGYLRGTLAVTIERVQGGVGGHQSHAAVHIVHAHVSTLQVELGHQHECLRVLCGTMPAFPGLSAAQAHPFSAVAFYLWYTHGTLCLHAEEDTTYPLWFRDNQLDCPFFEQGRSP